MEAAINCYNEKISFQFVICYYFFVNSTKYYYADLSFSSIHKAHFQHHSYQENCCELNYLISFNHVFAPDSICTESS